MRGKHGIHRHGFHGAIEIQPLRAQQADAFQHQKRRMAFIDMPHRGLEAHCIQCAHAANAQHDFLLDAQIAVAAIQLMRDVAIFVCIFFKIRIEQDHAHMPDHRLPNLDRHLAPQHGHDNFQFRTVIQPHRRNR